MQKIEVIEGVFERMKRVFGVGSAVLVLAMLLTGCGSAPVKDVYTAVGDGTKPAELQKTGTFADNDDLNVVVKLNTHNRTLNVSAIFTSPLGDVFNTDTLEADETVGDVLLGLDWESRNSVLWDAGKWTVDVYVDDAREKQLHFTVNTSTPG
jgi:hypothetical protein